MNGAGADFKPPGSLQAVNALTLRLRRKCAAAGFVTFSVPDDAPFHGLRHQPDCASVRLLADRRAIETKRLPLLWGAELLHGAACDPPQERHVHCESNCTSNAP